MSDSTKQLHQQNIGLNVSECLVDMSICLRVALGSRPGLAPKHA